MFSKLRSRLTYANVVATLALFFALGGGAYAAATIGSAQVIDNSLKSQDLKDNAAVRSRDVVDDTVTGGGLAGYDVKNNSLTSADVANLTGADVSNDSLTGQQINESSLGRVPDAAHADSTSVSEATNADTLDNLDSTDFFRSRIVTKQEGELNGSGTDAGTTLTRTPDPRMGRARRS